MGSLLSRTYAQGRTTQDGVFSPAQAARGAALYQEQCGACHGGKLEGSIGPELAGPGFLGVWGGGQPVYSLFDKVAKTMPAESPGTLSSAQVADVVAYMLQANQFRAGTSDLGTSEAALKQVSLVSASQRTTGAAPAAGASLSFPATGNMNQLMRGILFPSSNVLFDVQTQDPSARKAGARPEAATTSSRYGDVYEPWAVVDAAAISLAEVGPLLMIPRRCENGKPAPIDQANWRQWVQELGEAGRAAYKASQSRNQELVSEVTNQVSDACANCHRVYRDTATAASRCTPP